MRKKELKISLFLDDMILYIENSKEPMKNTQLINEISKGAEYKVNRKS